MTKPTLLLFDSNSFMHRAYHSVTYLSNIDGHPTNAITGFLKMAHGVIEHNTPEKVIFVFDAKGKTFRHEMFNGYKGDRKPTDPTLKAQFPVIKELVKHWGFPIVEVEGVEADDSLITLAYKGKQDGYRVIIATSDKDMYQGVDEDILILDTKAADKSSDAKPVGVEGTIKKFGVKPSQIIDYLALLGDVADSIPGVAGCGEKTAVKLINEYGDIETILENAHAIKGKAGKSLQAGFDYKLSRDLITIKKDADTGEISDLHGVRNDEELYKLASTYELRDFINTQGLSNPNPNQNPMKYSHDINELLSAMASENSIKHVIEIDNKSPFNQLLISDLNTNTLYSITIGDFEYQSLIGSYIEEVEKSESKEILTTDSKELIKELGSLGLTVSYPEFKDYRIYHYNRFSRSAQDLNYDYINFWSANIQLSDIRKEFKLDTKKPTYKGMTIEQYFETKLDEHFVLSRAIDKLQPTGVYSERPIKLDHDYMHVLAHKEMSGVGLSVENLDKALDALLAQREELQGKVDDAVGYPLKTSSPKEVKAALFDTLEIPIKKQSTNAKDLEPLIKDYPVVGWVIEIRSIDNLISTYVKGFKKRVAKDGRIYATYLATKTASSRISCEDPNLMAIPNAAKGGNSELIRSSFIAQQRDGEEERSVLSIDCSQAELVILAGLSSCQPLIDAFNKGEDIHAMTGNLIYDDYINSDGQRRSAKAVNFGLIYGLSPSALAKDLGISLDEAKELKAIITEKLGDIESYHVDLVDQVKKDKFYKTATERVFHFGNVSASNSMVSSEAIRSLKSVSNQAVVSDIIKEASISIFNNIMTMPEFTDVVMMMQIHDELVFEIPTSKVESFSSLVKSELTKAVPVNVKMGCNHKVSKTL